jgi:catechol 2,3-dioxygenase-like lactoylglutathione lyase family enzyme
MILGFAHPSLVVPDLERAREFYEAMFGFTHAGDEGWADSPESDQCLQLEGSASRGYMLKGHNCYLELFEYSAPAQMGPEPSSLGANEPGIRHIAFYVDDCRKEFERFKQLGGQAMGEPVGSDETGWAVYCRDPFGNIIELAEVMSHEEPPTSLPGFAVLGTFDGA